MGAWIQSLVLACAVAAPMAAAGITPESEGYCPKVPDTNWPCWPTGLAHLAQQVRDCWAPEGLSPIARALTIHVSVRFAPGGYPESVVLYSSDGGAVQGANTEAFEAARRALLVCGANGYQLPPEASNPGMFVVLRFEAAAKRLDVTHWGYD